ncbi:hypothetical protein ERJ70_06360 [Sediminibacillus dalangtanensis]|uniref:Uncharacterized protein n=1 Tax=Sediminibacillus dalangtanensis TaxID=2729421 RepID=A0ABX7VR27_9BACI|nr:hypothetical protein [Sediminibacillus dalangtanensis]QTM98958.1 hypothetical protein ERJ70_06360 [Sediminibacillus dalangtanensis]
MTDRKQSGKLAGLHTLVALILLFLASVFQSVSPFTYLAVFFFYLGLVNLVSHSKTLIPAIGSLIIGIFVYLIGVWI